ncbi:helix-turn-helix domain-containing protein [Nocardioides zeicaulis]
MALRCQTVARGEDAWLAAAFGMTEQMEPLYRRILPGSGLTLAQVAASMALPVDDLLDQLAPLVALSVVAVEDGVLHVVDPATATSRALAQQAEKLLVASRELMRLADVLPALGEPRDERMPQEQVIDGDVSAMADVPATIAQWVRENRGDLSFLRPDQWRFPSESEMAVAVGNAIRSGRRVRAIYPARALTEAPEVLRTRAEIGEEIRVVPSVPTRLVVVGPRRAIVPEPLGVGAEHRVVVRQAAVVGMFQAYFDELWDRAGHVDARAGRLPPRDQRRMLLAELADGVKDEQIARNLDVSLRTVRRRVADLMDQLDVDTRFQLGVEAARRGWL